ncbi:ImmA/IrrE family metallo-endopeptidase [Marinobacterium lacunae]|uniref:ImmA/IrrE family metallo-endopeptidase n=1 Tax=Marinobacterium lacunae TaxID=1232683 RepID=UPI00056CE0A9|nr:hypothetical protein [Marinobacterium lacunae]
MDEGMELSGRQIAESAFSDIESFFYRSAKFRVRREYGQSNMKSHAMCSGSGERMRIRLSQDFCEFQAASISDYMFILIVLCHELAHYLNNHNSHADKEKLDSIAVEARADHFGAQIFMTLLTFGNKTQKSIQGYQSDMTQKALIGAIAVAINDAYEKLFKPSDSSMYPDPEHRAKLLIVGCLSFFNRYFRPLPEGFAISFLVTVIRVARFVQNTDGEKQLAAGEIIQNRIHEVHREIESKARFRLDGVKFVYGYFLSANFDQTIEERKAYKGKLDQMIGSWGILNGDQT